MAGADSPAETVIGVTGHRVLMELAKVETGVDLALTRFARDLDVRTPRVLSSLAEGADRLVAERGIDLLGASLTALLPFSPSVYENDFRSEESRREFEALLERADEVIELPAAASRRDAYCEVGRFLISASDALVSVWDGRSAQSPGGTGWVVELARDHRVPLAWVHAGNRLPGTLEPSTLGAEQGRVSFENLEASASIGGGRE